MAAANHRQQSDATAATLVLSFTVGAFAAGVTGATLALLDGLSFFSSPVLTTAPLAVVFAAAGVIAVLFYAPIGLVLWLFAS